MRSRPPRFVCLIVAAGFPVAAWSQLVITPVPVATRQVEPAAAGVRLEQVNFAFDAGLVPLTNWGQLVVDPLRWRQASHLAGGYLNVFLAAGVSSSAPPRLAWQVQNLCLPTILTQPCSADGTAAAAGPALTTYLNLRPGDDRPGRLSSVQVVLLVSSQPLPVVTGFLAQAQRLKPSSLRVEQVTIDAEGDLGEFARAVLNPNRDLEVVGPPPVPPMPMPQPPLDLAYPLEVFQTPAPNFESARNQCVPMAHANVLAYLENRYNGGVLTWSLPHSHSLGLGRIGLSGDITVWSPIPANSLVSRIDARTRRNGTWDRRSGSGSTRCQNIEGVLTYLGIHGDQAQTLYRHQGGDPFYGDGGTCDTGTQPFNGRASQQVGEQPTWAWIFEQLQQGRGVAMSYGRYSTGGNRTGGHMLRVWGAARYNNRDYLFTLDDADQSNDNDGLRLKQWEVADTGSPGNPGIPDGRLNLDGTSWEIEFAIAAEALPTLNLP